MSILQSIKDPKTWDRFLDLVSNKPIGEDKLLIKNINKVMKDGIENIDLTFPIPVRKQIAKYKNSKKRVVYSFGEPYNTYLKAINFLLQEKNEYANKFCINSVAYQKGKTVKTYVVKLRNEVLKNKRKEFIKTDFSDYFNSINKEILFNKVDAFFEEEDKDLVDLIKFILNREEVYSDGEIINIEEKGVMAGIPISGYLANIYMNDVDWVMYREHRYYTRYADDVIILTNDREQEKENFIKLLEPLKVTLNPKKIDEGFTKDGLVFLGFFISTHKIDLNQRSLDKMKKRIKRRSKWFNMWLAKKKIDREVAARTFIKGMNGKFYARDSEDKTCWMEWYANTITTTESLELIDAYMIQYVRYILSGKHKGYKKNAEIPYEKIKELGFRSLVNEYWKIKKGKNIFEENV